MTSLGNMPLLIASDTATGSLQAFREVKAASHVRHILSAFSALFGTQCLLSMLSSEYCLFSTNRPFWNVKRIGSCIQEMHEPDDGLFMERSSLSAPRRSAADRGS